MKKLLSCLLALCMVIGMAACGDPQPSEPQKREHTGKTLLFQIDQSVSKYELVGARMDDIEALDAAMQNIDEALSPLKERYYVAVSFQPHWYYREEGWGEDSDPLHDPLDRLAPAFLHALDYFTGKGYTVYSEIMSSDIYTNQNGELGVLPFVDINYGDESKPGREVKGLSMDMQTVAALKERYDNFAGLRFHELIGTNRMGENPPDDPFWGQHAYVVDREAVTQIIDTVAENDMQLIWSDHSLHSMETSLEAFWKTYFSYAEEKLGDDLIVMWANNLAPGAQYLNLGYLDTLKSEYPDANLGISNQNWFATALLTGNSNEQKTWVDQEMDMSYETLAGFTLRALFEKDCTMVQFEPCYQMFNWYDTSGVSTDLGINGDIASYDGPQSQYEIAPNYSGRTGFLRFRDYLLEQDMRWAKLENFYSTESGNYGDPSESLDFKFMQQSTVVAWNEGEFRVFDKYVDDKSLWTEQDNRFAPHIFDENLVAANRIALTRNGYDEIIVAKNVNGKVVAEIYNEMSGKILTDETVFADNEYGKFVTFTTANLSKEFVSNAVNDPDEIIVAREKDGIIHLSCYYFRNSKVSHNRTTYEDVMLTEMTPANEMAYMINLIGAQEFPAETFVGIYGIRSRNSMYFPSQLRPLEGLMIAQSEGTKTVINGKKDYPSNPFTLEIDEEVYGVLAMDADLDVALDDEVCYIAKEGDSYILKVFENINGIFVSAPSYELNFGENCPQIIMQAKKSFLLAAEY